MDKEEDVLEELRLGRAWISENQHINVAANIVMRLDLVHGMQAARYASNTTRCYLPIIMQPSVALTLVVVFLIGFDAVRLRARTYMF